MQAEQLDGQERDELTPTPDIYRYFQNTLHLSARTLQWYATEGLIPKPVRRGRDAFYDVQETQIYGRVHTIYELQTYFGFRLWQIKELLERYEGQDLRKLQLLLENLRNQYPRHTYDAEGSLCENARNVAVQECFFDKLEEDVPLDKLSVIEVEKEVDQLSEYDLPF